MPQPSTEQAIEATVLRLVQARGPDKSICPSEAARELAPVDPAGVRGVIRLRIIPGGNE
jgi:hypothetical protein